MFRTLKTDDAVFVGNSSLWCLPMTLVHNLFSFRATSTSCLNHPKDGDDGVSQNIGST